MLYSHKRSKGLTRILYYTPRILLPAFILFLVTYAWGETDKVYYVYSKLLAALGRKLITAFIMSVLSLIAIRYELLGGILFIIFASIYFIFQWDLEYYLNWGQNVVGIFNYFIGVLFILNYERPLDTYD